MVGHRDKEQGHTWAADGSLKTPDLDNRQYWKISTEDLNMGISKFIISLSWDNMGNR